jgi:hypothetical protein
MRRVGLLAVNIDNIEYLHHRQSASGILRLKSDHRGTSFGLPVAIAAKDHPRRSRPQFPYARNSEHDVTPVGLVLHG